MRDRCIFMCVCVVYKCVFLLVFCFIILSECRILSVRKCTGILKEKK